MRNSLDTNHKLIFKTIKRVVTGLEIEMRDYENKGVFFVPELYLAFEIGKALYKDRKDVFGTYKIEWLRETNLGNGGPSDLIFKSDDIYIVFEFKISSTSNAYKKDIEKLYRLSEITDFIGYRFFVALIDSFPEKADARIQYLENLELDEISKTTIETNYSRYSNKINCELFLCKIR